MAAEAVVDEPLAVRTMTVVAAPDTAQCGVREVVNVSIGLAVASPTNSSCTISGTGLVYGALPVIAASGRLVFSSRFRLFDGPAIARLTLPAGDIDAQPDGVIGFPASSCMVNVNATFSPGWILPALLFVPASVTLETTKWMPGLTRESLIGCTCAVTGLSVPENSPWQNVQELSLPWAGIVARLDVYGCVQLMSSWQEPHARRVCCV